MAALFVALSLSGCAPVVYWSEPPGGEHRPGAAAQSEREQMDATQRLLAAIMASRSSSSVKAVVNGESVLIDFDPAEQSACKTLLITYQDLQHSETWQACADGIPVKSTGGTPKLPAGSDFSLFRHAAIRAAWHNGYGQVFYADYQISATASRPKANPGCVLIDTQVSQDDRVLDVAHEMICEGPTEPASR